jgi:hypothetical protein
MLMKAVRAWRRYRGVRHGSRAVACRYRSMACGACFIALVLLPSGFAFRRPPPGMLDTNLRRKRHPALRTRLQQRTHRSAGTDRGCERNP